MSLFGYIRKGKPANWMAVKGATHVKSAPHTVKPAKPRQPIKRTQRPIAAKSARGRRMDGLYGPLCRKFKAEHPNCGACLRIWQESPPRPTEDVHHKKGRGKYYLVVETWLAVCRRCHTWIGDNPEKSYAFGLLVKRGK